MKRLLVLASAAAMLTTGVAVAAPGDFVTISGTIQQERSDHLVVRGDDGKIYIADLRGANQGRFLVGDSVRIAGYAGPRPDQITVAIAEPAHRAGGARTDDAVVIDGWRLPQSHAYQAQDDRGVYHPLQPRDIPATIARGKEVYDLTAQAWVNHPTTYASTGGRNPAYTFVEAPGMAGDALVIDGWRLPQSHAYQAQDDQGVYHPVRPRDIPATIARGKEVYDLTARAWVNHPTTYASTGGRNPAYTASAIDRPGGGWEQVRGTVEQVDRQHLTLRTDDGRRMVVDISEARLATRPDRGDRVVALGYTTGTNRFDARYIGEERRGR